MDNRIQALINGAGAIAELMRIHYDAFIKVGFNETQSLILASRLMEISVLKNMGACDEEEEDEE